MGERITIPSGILYPKETIRLTPDIVGEGLTISSADPKHPAVLSGGRTLTLLSPTAQDGFARYSLPNRWRSRGIHRMLVIDGKWTSPARHPNAGYLRIAKAVEDRRTGLPLHGHLIGLALK